MKVIVDASVLISYLLATSETNPFRILIRKAAEGSLQLLLSEKTIEEFTDSVARKPHLSKHITPQAVESLVKLLRVIASVSPEPDDPNEIHTRDVKDDSLVAHAIRTDGDFLVTGDKDLLEYAHNKELCIISPATFMTVLEQQPS